MVSTPVSPLSRFKRLSTEERVNALSTVCPHLVEIFTTMHQRGEQTGKEGSSFARIAHSLGGQYQEHQYFNPSSPYHRHAYQAFPHHFYPSSEYQNTQGSPSFDDLFYHRPASSSETQYLSNMRNGERAKLEAESVIITMTLLL